MSEQTPTSTEDLNGAEPSMEDILASIRKIISEDEPVAMESPEDVPPVELVSAAAPVATQEPLSSFGDSASDLTSDAVLDAAGSAPDIGAAEGESVDLNIDDVLAGLAEDDLSAADSLAEDFTAEDLQIPEVPADATEDFSIDSLMTELDLSDGDSAAAETTASAFENDDDVLAFLDSNKAGVAGAAGAAVVAGAVGAVTGKTASEAAAPEVSDLLEAVDLDGETPEVVDNLLEETASVSDDVEMDALLDDILLSSDEAPEEIPVEGVEDFTSEDVIDDYIEEPEVLSEAEQSDLDLVKSLMAELADDPSYEELEDLENSVEIEEAPAADSEKLAVSEMETPEALTEGAEETEEDILGDILDMSLEDELQSQPDDLDLGDLDLGDLASLDAVAAAEQENILENILEDAAPLEAVDPIEATAEIDQVTELPSLAEIAAAAQADAAAVEAPVETSAGLQPAAAAVGLTAAGAGLAALVTNVADEPEAEITAAEIPVGDVEVAEAELEAETTDIEIAEAAAPEIPAVETAPETSTETQTETQSLSNQETSMPVKAVKTDTIIDEVTETATIGAFAELNQVVEDKAIFNERGPRIGDLVQEALRPMLKEWLDANLKGIVERAVTKEVKRISKGQ